MTDEEPIWKSTGDDLDPDSVAPSDAPTGDPVSVEPEGLFSRIRWGLISFIVLSVIVIVLAAQNTQAVTVKALGWEAEAPLIVILLITVLVSVVLDELVGVIIRRRRRTRRAERRELKELRKHRPD